MSPSGYPTVAGTKFPTMDAAAQILKANQWDINSLMGDWVDRGPWTVVPFTLLAPAEQ